MVFRRYYRSHRVYRTAAASDNGTWEMQWWECRRTPDEIRPQFAFSQVVGSDVAIDRTRHYVRWTDVEGLDGIFGLFQRLDGLTALSS